MTTDRRKKLIDVLREHPKGVKVADSKTGLSGKWILDPSDMDAVTAAQWMIASRIDVIDEDDKACTADLASFVDRNFDFMMGLIETGWEPKPTGDHESDLDMGVQVLHFIGRSEVVAIDALRIVAYLDPFIDDGSLTFRTG